MNMHRTCAVAACIYGITLSGSDVRPFVSLINLELAVAWLQEADPTASTYLL